MSDQQARITHLGPGYVQFDTTPTDEQLAEARRLLADLDRAMAEGADESGDDRHPKPKFPDPAGGERTSGPMA